MTVGLRPDGAETAGTGKRVEHEEVPVAPQPTVGSAPAARPEVADPWPLAPELAVGQ